MRSDTRRPIAARFVSSTPYAPPANVSNAAAASSTSTAPSGASADAGAAATVPDRIRTRDGSLGDEGRRERLDGLDLADQEASTIDEVIAGVDRDATAGQLPPEAPQERHVGVGTVVEHERRLQAADRAELPGSDEVADRAQRRRPAIRRTESVEDAGRAARVQESECGAGGRRERLLADDGLAGRRSREDDVRVQDRRQAGDDQVDIGRVDHPSPVGLDAA